MMGAVLDKEAVRRRPYTLKCSQSC